LNRDIDAEGYDGEEKALLIPVVWLSKEARFKIIETLISTRSIVDLARSLGVTPTAIRKYLRRDTHPSNEVIRRALAIMESYEEEKIFMIIIQDLLSALKMLYDNLDEPYKERMRKIIEETILQ